MLFDMDARLVEQFWILDNINKASIFACDPSKSIKFARFLFTNIHFDGRDTKEFSVNTMSSSSKYLVIKKILSLYLKKNLVLNDLCIFTKEDEQKIRTIWNYHRDDWFSKYGEQSAEIDKSKYDQFASAVKNSAWPMAYSIFFRVHKGLEPKSIANHAEALKIRFKLACDEHYNTWMKEVRLVDDQDNIWFSQTRCAKLLSEISYQVANLQCELRSRAKITPNFLRNLLK